MKVLCLHGLGGNAQMLEAQTNPITRSLKQNGHEFVFVDGIMQCDSPDARTKATYPPPYLAYYKSPVPEDVQEAIEYIHNIIEDEGPFDGIIGFSQGCCLATALMFERQKIDPGNVPFRFGIFMGASLPFNADDRSGKETWDTARSTGKDVHNQFAGELGLRDVITFPNDKDQLVWLGRYHPDKTPKSKLQIPVLHVIGKHDPYHLQARALARMHADPTHAAFLEHSGAHEVPREQRVQKEIANQILQLCHGVSHY